VAANPQTKPVDLDCESAENWQLSSTSTIAIVIINQSVGWYSFYRPTKGGRLSRPKHYSKGAQPVPKAVYHSSCRDKHNCQRREHNCQRRDSNLDPLTPQSDALTTRPLRPGCRWCLYSAFGRRIARQHCPRHNRLGVGLRSRGRRFDSWSGRGCVTMIVTYLRLLIGWIWFYLYDNDCKHIWRKMRTYDVTVQEH